MNRIDLAFKRLKAKKEKAFIAFITAGYPDLATTGKLVQELDRAGADIVELGVPFTDPMADGPVIQEASQQALKKHVTLRGILGAVKKIRALTEVPLCLMTYYNPIYCFGEQRFVGEACKAGVDGVIIPDLPFDEGKGFIRMANTAGLEVICFIAPTSTPERVKAIARVAKGFIYYVSLTGVTGARAALSPRLLSDLRRIKRITRKPVCVGFGVSSPAQVKTIGAVADGVIVGSAIVRTIRDYIGKPDLVKKVGRFVSHLKGA